ncbi:MAG: DUF4321 domain-containing protein [Acidobacteriota bacterium]
MAARRSSLLVIVETVLVLVVGGLIGSALAGLGQTLLGDGPALRFLTRTWRVGLEPPAKVDLEILRFTFGATLDVGVLTAVGVFLALWLYWKLR